MRVKEIVVSVAALIILALVVASVFTSSPVFAQVGGNDWFDFDNVIGNNTTTNTAPVENTTPPVENIVTENTTPPVENTQIPTPTANNVTNEADKDNLPETGLGSSMAIIIIIVGASSIYAYKKISDYNI